MSLPTFSQTLLTPPPDLAPEALLKKYIRRYQLPERHSSCNYVNVNLPETRDVSNSFIRHNLCPSLVAADFFNATGYVSKAQATFIFVDRVAKIAGTIDQLRGYQFWNPRCENHFIICDPIGTDLVPQVLEDIWKKHVLNFVVVLVSRGLQVFSYNPFRDGELLNVSDHRYLFPDKLSNLHGYQLRVSLFNDFPLTVKEDGRWRGGDYVRLRMVASMMNASFRIIEPPEQTYYTGAYQDAMSDVTDFCFISHFYMSYLYQDADYTYPHEQNEIAVVIPRGESSEFDTYTMLSIFDPVTWSLLLTSMVVVSLVTFLSNKRQSLSAIFLQSFNSFLGNPIHDFNSKPTSVKIQLLAFILGCIICGTAFQSFLVSSFVNPKSYQHITTISELRNSKLNIYTSIFLAKMIPPEHGLCGRVFVITAAERVKRLYSLDTRTAYVIIGTFARKFVETLESKYDLPPFYIMKEPLVPSANTYIFQRHSPYLDKISNCLQRLIQHGLLNSREYRRTVGRNSTQSDDKIVLGLQHLSSVFYILLGGLVLSSTIFSLEIMYKYRGKFVDHFNKS